MNTISTQSKLSPKVKKLVLLLLCLAFFGGVAQHFIVINTTPSVSKGLYLQTWTTPEQGDLVLVDPPDNIVFREARKKRILSNGLSSAGTCYMIKIVAATAGDEVEIRKEGMFVNGEKLTNSQRQNWQIEGMVELPIKKKLKDEVLLYTPHPRSFDSRYFGLLERKTILSSLKPLFLWN